MAAFVESDAQLTTFVRQVIDKDWRFKSILPVTNAALGIRFSVVPVAISFNSTAYSPLCRCCLDLHINDKPESDVRDDLDVTQLPQTKYMIMLQFDNSQYMTNSKIQGNPNVLLLQCQWMLTVLDQFKRNPVPDKDLLLRLQQNLELQQYFIEQFVESGISPDQVFDVNGFLYLEQPKSSLHGGADVPSEYKETTESLESHLASLSTPELVEIVSQSDKEAFANRFFPRWERMLDIFKALSPSSEYFAFLPVMDVENPRNVVVGIPAYLTWYTVATAVNINGSQKFVEVALPYAGLDHEDLILKFPFTGLIVPSLYNQNGKVLFGIDFMSDSAVIEYPSFDSSVFERCIVLGDKQDHYEVVKYSIDERETDTPVSLGKRVLVPKALVILDTMTDIYKSASATINTSNEEVTP